MIMATTTTPSLALRRSKAEPQPKVHFMEREYFFVVFSILHLPLGLLMEQSPLVSTIHAIATFLVGLYILAFRRRAVNIILFSAYVIGAEVVWRATQAGIFWETGKYLTAFMLISLLFIYKRSTIPVPALLFFMILLISTPTTLLTNSLADVKDYVSYYLSGPFLIAVALISFSNFPLKDIDLLKLCRFMLAPLFAMSGAIVTHMASIDSITFINDSNDLFSAGFGPNQVSAMLGFGAILAFIIAVNCKMARLQQIFHFVTALVMIIQAILTFSRGGVLMALVVTAIATLLLFRVKRTREVLIVFVAIAPIIAFSYILPRLNDYTQGAFEIRFTDTQSSGRENLIEGDMVAFQTYPLWGAGPGGSEIFHLVDFYKASRSHTEYSRLLAEHGVIGVAAMALLAGIVVVNFFSKRTPLQFAILVPFAVWGFMFLAVNGFRLGAPAYMIGLSALGTLVPPSMKQEVAQQEEQPV
jgi:O-antigen ligase